MIIQPYFNFIIFNRFVLIIIQHLFYFNYLGTIMKDLKLTLINFNSIVRFVYSIKTFYLTS